MQLWDYEVHPKLRNCQSQEYPEKRGLLPKMSIILAFPAAGICELKV
jgi:hypothetical protein